MTGLHDIEVILVGDELLKGEKYDSHLAHLGRVFCRAGVRMARAHVVGDSVREIAELVNERRGQTRVLIVTGGLGPTPDDITRVGVASALGLELEFHEPSWEAIKTFFAERGREVTDNNRGQASFPVGAEVIPNRGGTAPGFVVESGGTTVFVLPGPPAELRLMVETDVLPRLRSLFPRDPIRVETFRTVGIGESKLLSLVGEALQAVTCYSVSSLPSPTGVDIVLTELHGVEDRRLLDSEADAIEAALRQTIGSKFYERGARSLVEVIGEHLTRRGETLAVAESLTGGWIGKLLTDVSGSSAYFLADCVAYSNEHKIDALGVSGETIVRFGAVSEETCTEMANGARQRAGATYGLATTGIAGPTGGTAEKPVGLTYIGVSSDDGCRIKRIVYSGNRDDVRRRASHGALWLLFDLLTN